MKKILFFTITIAILIASFAAAKNFLIPLLSKEGQGEAQGVRAAATESGLVGYWTMDAGDTNGNGTATTTLDKSGNGHNGTVYRAYNQTGQMKQSMYFEGNANSYVNAGTFNIANGNNFTFAAWVKPVFSGGTMYIIEKGNDNTGSSYGLMAAGTDGVNSRICLMVHDSGERYACSNNGFVKSDRWYYAVGTNINKVLSMYINGDLQSGDHADQSEDIAANNNTVYIGMQNRGGTEYPFRGYVDDLRAYSYGMSAQEVTKLYNATRITHINSATEASSTPSAGNKLVGYWTMDNGDRTGNKILDRSGYGNNGTLSGTTTSTGMMGQAIRFKDTGCCIVNDNQSIRLNKQLTYSIWVKLVALPGGTYVISDQNDYGLFGTSATNLIFFLDGNVNSFDPKWVVGQWTSVISTWDGTTANTYINGVLMDSDPKSGALSMGGNPLVIGANSADDTCGAPFPGDIDEVRLYNYGMSAQEVMNLYNAAKITHINTVSEAGLVGYWTMDLGDKTGGVVLDRSGNNNSGTINGNTTSTPGVIREARYFDWSNSGYIKAGLKGMETSTNVTISFWAKLTDVSQQVSVIGTDADDGGNRLNIHFPWAPGPTSYIFWDFGNIGTTGRLSVAWDSKWNNVWAHWAFISENGVGQKIYRNSILIASDGDASSFTKGTKSLTIGSLGTSYYWRGYLDDLRIYNRALSAQEVTNLYNARKMDL